MFIARSRTKQLFTPLNNFKYLPFYRFCESNTRKKPRHSRYSPFVNAQDKTIDLLKAYSFYYTHPHPEISPYLFLTNTLFNEFGSIGLLSNQMRNYPHRILNWTQLLLNIIPSFTESELKRLDKQSYEILKNKFNDPEDYLIKRRKHLVASTLYSLKDLTCARFASEYEEFKDFNFNSESLLFGKFIDIASSIEIDNPIKFLDSPKALIQQYLKVLKLPSDDIVECRFPLSYWNM